MLNIMNLVWVMVTIIIKSTNDELSEFSINFIAQVDEVGVHIPLGQEGIFEFHLGQLKEVLFDGVIDDSPWDLLVGLNGLVDHSLWIFEESHNALHHAEGLVQGAVEIIGGECILLQEIFSDNFSDLQRE